MRPWFSDGVGFYAGPAYFLPRRLASEVVDLIMSEFSSHPNAGSYYVYEFLSLVRGVRQGEVTAMLKYKVPVSQVMSLYRMIWWDGARFLVEKMRGEFDFNEPKLYDRFEDLNAAVERARRLAEAL